MVSYDGLKQILREKGMTKTDLCTALGIYSRTVAKDFPNGRSGGLPGIWNVTRNGFAARSPEIRSFRSFVRKKRQGSPAGCIMNCR